MSAIVLAAGEQPAMLYLQAMRAISEPLTHEAAELLRRPVKCREITGLEDLAVISGQSNLEGPEISGSAIFQTSFHRGNRSSGGERFWMWRKRSVGPTAAERSGLPDWPGINDKDPLTWGHIATLAKELQSANAGTLQPANESSEERQKHSG